MYSWVFWLGIFFLMPLFSNNWVSVGIFSHLKKRRVGKKKGERKEGPLWYLPHKLAADFCRQAKISFSSPVIYLSGFWVLNKVKHEKSLAQYLAQSMNILTIVTGNNYNTPQEDNPAGFTARVSPGSGQRTQHQTDCSLSFPRELQWRGRPLDAV